MVNGDLVNGPAILMGEGNEVGKKTKGTVKRKKRSGPMMTLLETVLKQAEFPSTASPAHYPKKGKMLTMGDSNYMIYIKHLIDS